MNFFHNNTNAAIRVSLVMSGINKHKRLISSLITTVRIHAMTSANINNTLVPKKITHFILHLILFTIIGHRSNSEHWWFTMDSLGQVRQHGITIFTHTYFSKLEFHNSLSLRVAKIKVHQKFFLFWSQILIIGEFDINRYDTFKSPNNILYKAQVLNFFQYY